MKLQIALMLLLTGVLLINTSFAVENKTLERLGNEAAASGDSLFTDHKFTEAAQKYEEAHKLFVRAEEEDNIPLSDKINQMLSNMVASYYQAEDYENTIRILKIRLEHEPNNDIYARQISQIYEGLLNNSEKAAEVLIEFAKNNENFTVYRTIARLHNEMEKINEAINWYEKSFNIRQDPDVLQSIALLHHRLGNTKEAIKSYERFLETNPREAVLISVYRNMGRFYDDIGNNEKSIEFFERSNQLRFNRDITLLLLTKYFDKGDYTKARQKANLLLEDNPSNADAIYYTGIIFFEQEKYSEAKEQFMRITGDRRYGNAAKQYIESIDSM